MIFCRKYFKSIDGARFSKKRMMVKSQKGKIYPIIIFFMVVAAVLLHVICLELMLASYRNVNAITAVNIDGKAFCLKIPVVYGAIVSEGQYEKIPLYTNDGKIFGLHWRRDSGPMFLSISRWEFGGWVVMNARYRITDEAVRKKLHHFLSSLNPRE